MKKLEWVGSSKKDLADFPKDVRQEVGYALYVAQRGGRYSKTKFFKGCGSGVYEIAIEYDTNAYRTVYILNLADTVYVIHCFQKKSKEGIKTPKEEVNIIKQRIKFVKSEIEKGIKSWLLKVMNK
jgi:phage-related protein